MKARYFLPAVAILSLCVGLCLASASAQQLRRPPGIIISQGSADTLSLTKVEPDYPDAVKSKEIAGQIVIGFTIDKDGNVSDVRPLDIGVFGCRSMNSDDPALQQAAIAAVKQWKFRPFLMHDRPGDAGEPVEVGTAVALPFDFRKSTGGAAASSALAGTAACNPREGATATPEFVQPKVDPSQPVFGALVIEPSRAEEMLVHKVEATYPQMARVAHIQGNVILHVLIDKQGHVANIKALQGHPLFIQPARDAVKQWEYQPFLLNGEPAEVETAVVVKFRM
ncbi:MAG TPA: energy transducer TonB [Candidatus Angelobacter sp.]